jgi:aerobic carbon-monoxide dehydrogenase medium subunit
VKPAAFAYATPTTVEEALGVLRADPDNTTVLAGGQSLVPMLNLRMAAPDVVLDLNGIPELARVEAGNGGMRLGAMVRQRALETDERIARRLPLMTEAATHIAHIPIRTRGTLGGSLAHAEPSAELPATIAALDGRMVLRGARGERSLSAADFFVGPLTTAREPDELLVAVEVDAPAAGTGWAFGEIARTHGAFALAGVAALVRVGADGRIERARAALCGVGSVPYIATWLNEAMAGEEPGAELFERVGRRVSEELDPYDDGHASAAYRRRVAGVITARALATAAERGRAA